MSDQHSRFSKLSIRAKLITVIMGIATLVLQGISLRGLLSGCSAGS